MTPGEPERPGRLVAPGLYLHVPFCLNLCPYCPYNRIKYREDLWALYESAVLQEIDLVAPDLQDGRFGTLYIGGGTPTSNWPGLIRILDHLRRRLDVAGEICIELHPSNMDQDCLAALKEAGVTMISIGVESTSDRLLRTIGRSHDGAAAIAAVERAQAEGFRSINVDLMFALPGQTLADWDVDLRRMLGQGVDQISTYPMFSFPYSDLGQGARLRQVKRPPHRIVRAMLDLTDARCDAGSLRRCAVWSWIRPRKAKFSSITRHHYVGFGPSAASMSGSRFSVNTFDVSAYAACLPVRRPVALAMRVDSRVEMAYWLYWRIYELKVADADFKAVFGAGESLDRVFGGVLSPLVAAGMMEKEDGVYSVTRRGAYWIHRLQNEYSLNYINRLWGACRKEPWPTAVAL